MKIRNIKGFFFDLDGTLIDSNLNFSDLREELGITEEQDILEYVESIEDIIQKKYALDRIHDFEFQGAQKSQLISGVSELINFLNLHKIPFGVLTRNSRFCSDLMIKKHQIQIDQLITREDARAKPDPQGLHILRDRFGLASHECIYVGDYIYDLDSAMNAGMIPVLYETGSNQQFRKQASFSITCYKDFLKELESTLSEGIR